MKRIPALILCLLIPILAFGGLTAFAADGSEASEIPLEVPQVRIVTKDSVGLDLKKADGYVDATVTIVDTDGNEIGGEATVKVRGNSTSYLPKKSYNFKFPKKLDVLGMGKAKKWSLLANAFDSTLWRNYIAMDAAAELGLEYTSQQQVVEVWMDGAFRGCYNLIEPVQEGKTRVDIDIESNNGLNDFMVEREYNHNEADATYFRTNGIRFVCSEPDEPTEEQLAYIQSTMDRVIAVLKSGDREAIENTIDVASFVKYAVLNEFVKDVDFDYSSVFFYYKGGKLYAGPAWDYDLSMGNAEPAASDNYAASCKTDGIHCAQKHLYQWLYEYDWFLDLIKAEYREHREYFDNIGADGGLIDALYQTYAGPVDRNFSKDGANWNLNIYYINLNRRPDRTYQANLDFLKTWCSQRAAWLDEYTAQETLEYLLGDANNDGEVDITDATFLQRYDLGLPVPSIDGAIIRRNGDVNSDGNIDVNDATFIQRYDVELDTPYSIGEYVYTNPSQLSIKD